MKACSGCHLTLSSSVCRGRYLSFILLVFHTCSVWKYALLFSHAYFVSSGLLVVLMKEEWLVACFPGCISSRSFWWSMPSGVLIGNSGHSFITHWHITDCLGRGNGLTSLIALSAAPQITSLWMTRVGLSSTEYFWV